MRSGGPLPQAAHLISVFTETRCSSCMLEAKERKLGVRLNMFLLAMLPTVPNEGWKVNFCEPSTANS